MKAYIKTFEESNGYRAEVVTEDDYHNRGPFSRSYLSPWCLDRHQAFVHAHDYCTKNNLIIVQAHEI